MENGMGKKLKQFIKYYKDDIIIVPLDKIILHYEVHKKGNEAQPLGKANDKLTVIAKPHEENGEVSYFLLFGYREYHEAKRRGLTEIHCLPRKESRATLRWIICEKKHTLTVESLQDAVLVPYKSIIIPDNFCNTKPSKEKVQLRLSFYEKNKQLPQPVHVSKDTMMLLDGYATYLAAIELGMKKIPVVYETRAVNE